MKILKLIFLLGCTSSLAAQVTDKQLLEAPGANWLHYNGSYDSRRFSSMAEVNTGNAGRLTAKWVFHMPGAGHLESVPIVVDGVMYVTQLNEAYAMDARSGRKIRDYHHVGPSSDRGPNRGVAIYGDKVFFSTPDAMLALPSTPPPER